MGSITPSITTAKAPACLNRLAIGNDLLVLLLAASACVVAAQHVDRLRGEADMRHHRNAALG